MSAYVCKRCGGDGEIDRGCDDPQCGDSTWDHYCTLGEMLPCPECAAKGLPSKIPGPAVSPREEPAPSWSPQAALCDTCKVSSQWGAMRCYRAPWCTAPVVAPSGPQEDSK